MAKFPSGGAEVEADLDFLMAGAEYGSEELQAAMRGELRTLLLEKRRLTVYLGADPTSPHLHLGHAVVLHALRRFQSRGHRVIFVIGDFTALIGDPTGRSKTRPALTRQEVEDNAATYAEQVFHVLDRDRTEIVFNSTWLSPLALSDVIRLVAQFTVAQLLTREDFRARFDAGVPVHLHELLYPLVMGQDAAHLRTDVQLGGQDQLLNILTGREVMRAQGLRPMVALTVPLLPGTDGKLKMSKSHGNDIGVSIEPQDMYGKVMSIPDTALPDYFRLASGLAPADAEERIGRLAAGWPHRDAKMDLARTIVARWHGETAGAGAEAAFVAQFQRREVPDDAPELLSGGCATVLDLVVASGVFPSRSEARRKIGEGSVSLDGDKLGEWSGPVPHHADGAVLRVGKRHVFRLRR